MNGASVGVAFAEAASARWWLGRLVSWAIVAGYRVVAPVERQGSVLYGEIASAREIAPTSPMPLLPLKDVFLFGGLPPTTAQAAGSDGFVRRTTRSNEPLLIVGCRPCEAAALRVMGRALAPSCSGPASPASHGSAVVVSFACTKPDAHCFCTSVGGAPDSGDGSDVVAHRLRGGALRLEARTREGNALLQAVGGKPRKGVPHTRSCDGPRPKFDLGLVTTWLSAHRREPQWPEISTSCQGCGVCRFVCPTCRCFETAGAARRCCSREPCDEGCCATRPFLEDACRGSSRRATASKWRQWLLHKFLFFPKRFGRPACVGCGRCLRACGMGESLVRVLQSVERAATAAVNESAARLPVSDVCHGLGGQAE